MGNFQRYSSQYLIFHSLDYRKRVLYFEQNIKNNITIDYFEMLELKVEYIFALFELGRYEKYLQLVDDCIEEVVYQNFYTINDRDVFQLMIFKKANCFLNLERYDEALVIYKQLCNIDSNNKDYKSAFGLANRRINASKIHRVNIYIMLFFLGGLMLKFLDIFIIDPFYIQYHDVFVILSDGLAIIGFILLIYQYAKYFKEKYAYK